jgi:hypothetical protein
MSLTPRGNDPVLEPYLDMIFSLASCLAGAAPQHYTGLCEEAVQMLLDAKHSTTMHVMNREPHSTGNE